MLRVGCTVACLLIALFAEAQNNFRSSQSGDWNNPSTWEEFVAGSWVPAGSTPDNTSGIITVRSPHTVTVTAGVTVDQATVDAGGFLVVNDAVGLTLNNATGIDLTIDGTAQFLGEGFLSGAGQFTLNGTLGLGSLNGTGALVTGTTLGNIRTSGSRVYDAAATVTYEGTAAQFIGSGHPVTDGLTTEIDNANGVTFNQNTQGNTGATTRLSLTGILVLTSGDLNIVSTSGAGRTLSLASTVTPNANFITVSGPSTNLLFEGTGDMANFPFPAGAQTLSQITITRPANSITFNNAITLTTRVTVAGTAIFNGTLNSRDIVINSGSVDLNASTTVTGSINMDPGTSLAFDGVQLSMAGNFISSGTLSSNATSSMILTGTVALSSPLVFLPGSSLQTFSINKNTVGTSATFGSAVTVTNFNLTHGVVSNIGGSLTMANNGTITKSSDGSLITSEPSGGPWNLVYTQGSQSTGLEIPASGMLASLTINTASTTTVTLLQSVIVSGALTIPANSRTLSCGTNNVTAGSFNSTGTFSAPSSGASTGFTLNGNFVNNGTYTHNSGTLIIPGATVMSGTTINTTNFGSITIGAAGTLTAPATLNIAGNLTNNGSFVSGAGTVVFNGGASALLGGNMATTSFNNITINTGATLTQASNLITTGNLVVNGALTVGAGTNTFAGTTTLSGTNIATTQFNHLVINAASTLTAPTTTLRVGGNFTDDGTFNASTSTVLFTGTSSLLGTAINSANFNNITINGGATVTAPATLNVIGNFANNGTFNAGAGTVALITNAGAKTLSGTSNTQFFDLVLNKSNGGTSVTVSTPQTVTNSLNLADGILDNTGGNLTMNSGSTIIRTNLASITATPSGGPWHLIYQGASVTTSLEIPASGLLVSLTIDLDNTRNVTLSQAITVQNAITINNAGRTLLCGTQNVTAGSIANSGTFSAPGNASPMGLIVSGNFANNGIFTHNNGLVTFNGTTALSGSSTTAFNRLTVTGTLNAASSFSVAGHFTNNGTFSAPPLVTFNGTLLQNFTGTAPTTTFRGIRVTNTASPVSLSLQSNINLVDSLSLGANAKVDADGSSDAAILTLLSTSDAPAADAKVSRLPAGAQVLGNVTVQRFFRPADNFDRFLSSPVTNGTVAQLQASTPAGSFPVTGGFPGTSFPCTGCNNDGHNFRYYYEPQTGPINSGYKGFITSTASTLTPGVGYDAFMWNGVSNTTVSLRGPINTGSITLGVQGGTPGTSITHTNNGNASADGWNLVGNPYPSPIQWNNGSGWTRTNIDPTVWVWDVVGRVWHSFNANTSTGDLTNGVIAAGQGFWVYAPALGAGSISVNENVKSYGVSGTGSYYRTQADGRQRNDNPAARIVFSNGKSSDNVFLLSDPGATSGYDAGLDAPKLQIGIEHLSVSLLDASNRKLGHYAGGNKFADRIPLYVFGETDGEFSLRFENTETITALEGYYLVDEFLDESHLITPGQTYSFTMNASEPLSQLERFYLSRYPGAEKLAPAYRVMAYPNPASDVLTIQYNPAHVQEISLLDNSGRQVIRVVPTGNDGMQETRLDVGNQPAGLYILKVFTDGNVQTRKILVRH